MNLLAPLRKFFAADRLHTRDPADDFWYTPDILTFATLTGIQVNPSNAVSVPAVRRSLEVITDPIATLPRSIFRVNSDGSKQRANNHPLQDLLTRQPNSEQTASEFFGQMQWNLSLYHNAYALISPGPRGAIDQLHVLPPDRVRPFRARDGRIWYNVQRLNSAGSRVLSSDEIWHVRCYPLDDKGVEGVPRVKDANDTIGQALALQHFAGQFWRNSGLSGGVLQHPSHFKTPEQRDEYLRSWRQARTGDNAHRDALLEYGITYTPNQINNETSQFLETRKQLAIEIAQLWKVPPSKIGIVDGIKYNSAEQQAIAFVVDCLLPWIVLWEQAIKKDLILAPHYEFEFNLAGLLRGDLKSRYAAYFQGRNGGWLSVNDIRAMENMDGIGPDGDTYLEPTNMQPVGGRPKEPPAAANGNVEVYRSVDQFLREGDI